MAWLELMAPVAERLRRAVTCCSCESGASRTATEDYLRAQLRRIVGVAQLGGDVEAEVLTILHCGVT